MLGTLVVVGLRESSFVLLRVRPPAPGGLLLIKGELFVREGAEALPPAPAADAPTAEYGDAPTRCDWPPRLAPIRSRRRASAQRRLRQHLRG